MATLHLVTWWRRLPAPGTAEAEAIALRTLAAQHAAATRPTTTR